MGYNTNYTNYGGTIENNIGRRAINQSMTGPTFMKNLKDNSLDPHAHTG
jgi:hypothetical protein